jgi:hypothetical protein
MTTLLQQAIAEAEKLSREDQDVIAARWLAEIEDERKWSATFAATTDKQWDQIVANVSREVAAHGTRPLDDVFPSDESHQPRSGGLM